VIPYFEIRKSQLPALCDITLADVLSDVTSLDFAHVHGPIKAEERSPIRAGERSPENLGLTDRGSHPHHHFCVAVGYLLSDLLDIPEGIIAYAVPV
jgi:hypothetical protein